jgi:hypothetical protein
MGEDDNVFERYSESEGHLPKGWVVYMENPLTPQAMVVKCPLSAAPAWVRAKHANRDMDRT